MPYRLTAIEELDRDVATAEAQVRDGLRLERLLQLARLKREVLQARIAELEKAAGREASDVARLDGGVVALFHRVMGTLEDRRSKERQELASAELKLSQAVAERALVDEELAELGERAAASTGARERVAAARAAREQWLLANDAGVARAVAETDGEQTRLDAQAAELVHAIRAGQAARDAVGRLVGALDDARGLAAVGLLGGGDRMHLARHDLLDRARAMLPRLQRLLAGLDQECAGMGIRIDPAAFGFPEVDRFEIFADAFYDGLVSDWASRGRLESALQSADGAGRLIQAVLLHLDGRRQALETQLTELKAQRRRALGG